MPFLEKELVIIALPIFGKGMGIVFVPFFEEFFFAFFCFKNRPLKHLTDKYMFSRNFNSTGILIHSKFELTSFSKTNLFNMF